MMQYRFAADGNFEDFASGRVLYARPGKTAFPVRLASEIYQRCRSHWQVAGGEGLCTIYDPTCGGAYWLVVLAYLHWEEISRIYASDIDETAVDLAEHNLSLLTPQGLDRRISEIQGLLLDYGKTSHAGALASAFWFRQQLDLHRQSHDIATRIFLADATNPKMVRNGIGDTQVDILLADVPYGWHTTWQYTGTGEDRPIGELLGALTCVLSPKSVVAIAMDKRQKARHDAYQRVERFQVGKRRIEILRLAKHRSEF